MGSLQHENAQQLEADAHEEGVAYGCLFCVTGKEMIVAENIQAACPEVSDEQKGEADGGRDCSSRLCLFQSSFPYRTGGDFPKTKRNSDAVHGRRLAVAWRG